MYTKYAHGFRVLDLTQVCDVQLLQIHQIQLQSLIAVCSSSLSSSYFILYPKVDFVCSIESSYTQIGKRHEGTYQKLQKFITRPD